MCRKDFIGLPFLLRLLDNVRTNICSSCSMRSVSTSSAATVAETSLLLAVDTDIAVTHGEPCIRYHRRLKHIVTVVTITLRVSHTAVVYLTYSRVVRTNIDQYQGVTQINETFTSWTNRQFGISYDVFVLASYSLLLNSSHIIHTLRTT